eukprot:CFRG0510T1
MTQENQSKHHELRINTPNPGNDPLIFQWPFAVQDGTDTAVELLETIRLVSSDIAELQDLFTDDLESADPTSWAEMNDLVNRYNYALANILTFDSGDGVGKAPTPTKASVPLVQLIMRQVYNVIDDPKRLNQYSAFSEEVYGEFNFNIVNDIIQKAPITKDDIFMDLGSGVGQIVLQTSAQCQCKYSYGIEKRDIPHEYAMTMQEAYIQKMKWFGKSYGPFELHQGDFLDSKWVDIIQKCTVVFCNNYTFPAPLNQRLKEIFVDLEHGTRIISSASFMPLNFRISDRNTNDIGCIMNVRKVAFEGEGVSWTDKKMHYYIHTIDKTKLPKYFQEKQLRMAQARLQSSPSSDEENTSDEEFMPSAAAANAAKVLHHSHIHHSVSLDGRTVSRRKVGGGGRKSRVQSSSSEEETSDPGSEDGESSPNRGRHTHKKKTTGTHQKNKQRTQQETSSNASRIGGINTNTNPRAGRATGSRSTSPGMRSVGSNKSKIKNRDREKDKGGVKVKREHTSASQASTDKSKSSKETTLSRKASSAIGLVGTIKQESAGVMVQGDMDEDRVDVDEAVKVFLTRQRVLLRNFINAHNPQLCLDRLKAENARMTAHHRRIFTQLQQTTDDLKLQFNRNNVKLNERNVGVGEEGTINRELAVRASVAQFVSDGQLKMLSTEVTDNKRMVQKEEELLEYIKQLKAATLVVDESQRQKRLVKELKVLFKFLGIKIAKWKDRFEFSRTDGVKFKKQVESFRSDVSKDLREIGFSCREPKQPYAPNKVNNGVHSTTRTTTNTDTDTTSTSISNVKSEKERTSVDTKLSDTNDNAKTTSNTTSKRQSSATGDYDDVKRIRVDNVT